jgi:hypothetical protein
LTSFGTSLLADLRIRCGVAIFCNMLRSTACTTGGKSRSCFGAWVMLQEISTYSSTTAKIKVLHFSRGKRRAAYEAGGQE